MGESSPSFVTADYIVFSSSLAISLLIGLYQWYRSRGRDTKDFLMGGGHMSPVPVALSCLAGVVSAISILGNSSELYYYGSQLWMNVFGVMVGGALSVWIIVPVLFPLKFISIYEYMELRWRVRWLRLLSTGLQLINTFIFLGIALYAPSLAISSVTPISVNASILSLGLICVVYSSLGGAKAVVYTDTFQTFVMFAGVIIVIVQGCIEVGGGYNSWQIDKENGRIEFFNLDPSPLERHTLMTTLILGVYFSLANFATSQTQFQRWAAVATLRQAYFVMTMSILGLVVLWSLINYSGLVVFSVYADCDPLVNGDIEKADQILVFFVVDKLGYLPGIPGLFVAAVYSGVLSSVSSSLNGMAAMIWTDMLHPLPYFAKTSEAKAKNINILISLVSGCVAIVLGFLSGSVGGLVQVTYAIGGALSGPITGLFLTGILCPWVKAASALLGGICSVTLCLWITIGNFLYAPPPTMLPLSTDGCLDDTTTNNITTTTFPTFPTSISPTESPGEVFPLYLLSYCLYGAIGILCTFTMANLFCFLIGVEDPSEVPEIAVNKTCLRFYVYMKGTAVSKVPENGIINNSSNSRTMSKINKHSKSSRNNSSFSRNSRSEGNSVCGARDGKDNNYNETSFDNPQPVADYD